MVSFNVLSEDGDTLAKWYYADSTSVGKQFFNEISWQYQHEIIKTDNGRIVTTWSFNILPEDIE